MAKNSLKFIDLIFLKKGKENFLNKKTENEKDSIAESSKKLIDNSNPNAKYNIKKKNESNQNVDTEEVSHKFSPMNRTSVNYKDDAHKEEKYYIPSEGNKNLINNDNNKIDDKAEVERDSLLEYESMVLLSKIEQLAMKISEVDILSSKQKVIDILPNIVNHLIEFLELNRKNRLNFNTIGTILSQDHKNYKHLNIGHIKNNRLVIDINDKLYESDENFFEVCNEFLIIINVYLSLCIKAFHSKQISEQWKTLYAGFYVNLSKNINNKKNF